MEEQGLPGLQARYEFVPAGDAVQLNLQLRFDPAEAGTPEAARSAWRALGDHLGGGAKGDSPPAAVRLAVSLATAPLTATADGVGLGERLSDFASAVIAGLDRLAPAAPVSELSFLLAKADVAKLPRDIFEIAVTLDLGAGWAAPVGCPLLGGDQDAVAFAGAFESAWQGFDGAEGRIAVAVEEAAEDGALWCVRTGSACGISLARAADSKVAHYAVPPLSTIPLSGSIDDLDGAGGFGEFESVDLDLWWALFGAEFERLTDAAVDGEVRMRLDRVRREIAGEMAFRLLPLALGEVGDGLGEVRAVAEESAIADLRSRPVIVSTPVEVSRGIALPGEPESVLRGRVFGPTGTGSASAAAPAAVVLKAGRRMLAFAAPPARDRMLQAFALRFEGDRIGRAGAPPLRLLLQSPGGSNPLGLDPGLQSAPTPLIAPPSPPSFAVTAVALFPDAPTAEAALGWKVEIETPTTPSPQDRLELALDFANPVEAAVPPSPEPDGLLFEALGRVVHFASSAATKPDPGSIERFAAQAEAVAEALPAWRAPLADVPALSGEWRYSIDFRDHPALTVRREARASGRLPPWPTIAGYTAPDCEEAVARYALQAGAVAEAGLHISVPGLRLLADRAAQVHGRITRNGNLTREVEPAFVYHSGIASSGSVSPVLEWRPPEAEAPSASLAAALSAMLSLIDEGSGRPYALSLQAELIQARGPVETRIPLVSVPRHAIGGDGDIPLAEFKRQLADALSAAWAGMDLDRQAEAIAIALALFDTAADQSPLARLTFWIPVPSDPAWWAPVPA